MSKPRKKLDWNKPLQTKGGARATKIEAFPSAYYPRKVFFGDGSYYIYSESGCFYDDGKPDDLDLINVPESAEVDAHDDLRERVSKLEAALSTAHADHAELRECLAAIERAAAGEASAVLHTLYKTGDKDTPDQIKDSNGEVVLGQCRVCGKAESELDEPCEPNPPTAKRESWSMAGMMASLRAENERLTKAKCGADGYIDLLQSDREKLRAQLTAKDAEITTLERARDEARAEVEKVNTFARTLGYGQGELDSDLAGCIEKSFATYRAAAEAMEALESGEVCRVESSVAADGKRRWDALANGRWSTCLPTPTAAILAARDASERKDNDK